MTTMIIRLALLGFLVPPCGATGGPRTTIRLAPIAIHGNNDIAITAINDSGAVAGVLTDPAGYHVLVVTPDAVTELMRLLPGLMAVAHRWCGSSTIWATSAARIVKV